MIEFDEYKSKLNAARPRLAELEGALNLAEARAEIEKLEAEA